VAMRIPGSDSSRAGQGGRGGWWSAVGAIGCCVAGESSRSCLGRTEADWCVDVTAMRWGLGWLTDGQIFVDMGSRVCYRERDVGRG